MSIDRETERQSLTVSGIVARGPIYRVVVDMELDLKRSPEDLRFLFYALKTKHDVADLLEINKKNLIYYLYRRSPETQYTQYRIKKRHGGTRKILAPETPLKILQHKLNCVLQLVYKPKAPVHGFVTERSILTNARVHTGKRFVLNVDLRDFFPSINFGRVRGVFLSQPYGLDAAAATILAQICCVDNQLPQGAPTSPTVSNMVCARMDGEFQALAASLGCHYTRYADDLTFSTTRRTFPQTLALTESIQAGRIARAVVGPALSTVIESNGFAANDTKIWLFKSTRRQSVTGLTVNKTPNLPRRFANQIRAMLHAWKIYGYENAQSEFQRRYDTKHRRPGGKPAEFRKVVRGRLNYLRMIKGLQDATYLRLCSELAELDPMFAPCYERIRMIAAKSQLEDSVFVLECDKGQSTAFLLDEIGLVTCAHATGSHLAVYKRHEANLPPEKYDVEVVRRNEDLDIAILRFAGKDPLGLQPLKTGTPGGADRQVDIYVVGFPAYAPGQSISRIPGVITTTRKYCGEDRFSVNATIRQGNSGGPVLNSKGEVIGIAATGAASPEDEVTQDNGVIPISLLQHLRDSGIP
jgi:RNA-directed DNA polymerase